MSEKETRIKGKIASVDRKTINNFFDKRVKSYEGEGHYPLEITEYNDNKPDVNKRKNDEEWKLLEPILHLTGKESVLDVGSGTGQAFARIHSNIKYGLGIDASGELVKLSSKLVPYDNCHFMQGEIGNIQALLGKVGKHFDRALITGVLIYVNDDELGQLFETLRGYLNAHGVIYIRETLGLGKRLTLKNFYSEELDDNYNAIYRTPQEMNDIVSCHFPQTDFEIKSFTPIWTDKKLYSRRETQHQYSVIKKKD